MVIELQKFGDILSSRQAGKEAFLGFQPTLSRLAPDEEIIVDCGIHVTLTPSWADEFLSPLQEKYVARLSLRSVVNQSVIVTIRTLEQTRGFKFKIIDAQRL